MLGRGWRQGHEGARYRGRRRSSWNAEGARVLQRASRGRICCESAASLDRRRPRRLELARELLPSPRAAVEHALDGRIALPFRILLGLIARDPRGLRRVLEFIVGEVEWRHGEKMPQLKSIVYSVLHRTGYCMRMCYSAQVQAAYLEYLRR